MVQTTSMPKSVQSDIPMEAVGEALLQHYNVGITNPWFEAGYSDQETYNRRKLPWAGKSYNVSADGSVSGTNIENIPAGLIASWKALASEADAVLNDEEFDSFDEHYETLSEVSPEPADELASDASFITEEAGGPYPVDEN